MADDEVMVVEKGAGRKLSGRLSNIFEVTEQDCGWITMEIRKERRQSAYIEGFHHVCGTRFRVTASEDLVELVTSEGRFNYWMNFQQ